jgi:hypothetical protein
VARSLERVRQFLTRMWCGRMAVNGGEQQSIDLRVGRSTVIWFRSSGSRICRGAELGFWEREVGVACSLSWPSGSTHNRHVHILVKDSVTLEQGNITFPPPAFANK